MSFNDTHEFTSLGIPYPKDVALIANKSSPESIRYDLEMQAKVTDQELVKLQEDTDKKVASDDARLPYFVTNDAFMLVAHDRRNRATDLALDWTGQFDEFVVRRLAARMKAYLEVSDGAGLPTDRMLVDGVLVPVNTDMRSSTIWGSSSSQFIASALGAEFSVVAVSFDGQGKSAERIQHTAARSGAVPALLTVTGGQIPASGAVTVTASNMTTALALKPFSGTLHGVPGTLSATNTAMTFTRTGSGTAVTVPNGTPFISDLGTAYRQYSTHLWAGKNNWSDSGGAALVIDYTKKMFAWLSPQTKRSMVWGHFVDSDQTAGNAQHTFVATVNAALKMFFGDLFFDVQTYIASPQLWADAGISPTSADLTAQANRIKPPSVSQDAGHFNDAGNLAVAKAAMRHMRTVLGWY